jgi:putative endonuclease
VDYQAHSNSGKNPHINGEPFILLHALSYYGPVVQSGYPDPEDSGGAACHVGDDMFFTYILESQKDGSFYIGHTDDLEKRLMQHNLGLSKYTRRKRPWKVVYSEEYETREDARKREGFLKKQRNRDFYLRLIGRK